MKVTMLDNGPGESYGVGSGCYALLPLTTSQSSGRRSVLHFNPQRSELGFVVTEDMFMRIDLVKL